MKLSDLNEQIKRELDAQKLLAQKVAAFEEVKQLVGMNADGKFNEDEARRQLEKFERLKKQLTLERDFKRGQLEEKFSAERSYYPNIQ